jgi:RimJ/RimL family protein N-acetyltransferase
MGQVADGWGPVLSGERVSLRPIDPRLARTLISGTPGPDLGWEDGFPMAPVRGISEKIAEAPVSLGPFLAYVIVRNADGKAVGDAGFHGPPNAEGELELGYAVVPLARREGYARDAVELLIAWAKGQPGVRGFAARVEPGNTSSERLLTGLGFVPDGSRGNMQRFVLSAATRDAR